MTVAEMQETTQYLTFELDGEIFALDITKVREVLDVISVTVVPRAPDFLRGVVNLRGRVVPVVDLRVLFGMAGTKGNVNTCIIIAEVAVDGEATALGVLADSVHEVIELGQEQIEPAPRIGARLRTEFMRGIGKRHNQVMIILDIDRVFVSNEPAPARPAPGPSRETKAGGP